MIGVSTLSRYIAKLFLVSITSTLAVCALLIFMIDFVELLRMSGKFGNVPGLTLLRIALLRLPAYIEFLIGFAVLVGSISTLIYLNRKSELAVMRAGGMSVWQFLKPGLFVGLCVGIFSMAVFNPLASRGRATSEKIFAKAFGNETNLLRAQGGGSWIRQNGADGESILGAAAASNRGLTLTGVLLFAYDREGHFTERVDAGRAELKDGYWDMEDAWVARLGQQPEKYSSYYVSTYLTPDRVQEALGTVFSISFWDLPSLIEDSEKAKLSTERLRVQFQSLLVRPLLCLAMVLLAATVSLRSFRSGGIQTMVTTGMVGGVGFFLLSEIARQIGIAGLTPAWVSAWVPVILALAISTTVLLHQEDG
ncbi:LPS export ABC transporter permease LptG [Hyphomicrobium methylovorum]|uniref:LPS export ABC transporter permease LptG n=1 Tax=Hyphomicrobium methylovorum TaxID=84 RepID=UPI0015E6D088|nr:LPS export ABC transporter permease LptG [Hyphomicrobium methylovorum]MBA2127762.1 LPS export ABC transporter permease LptG [Hyphomicrobium methylovorum]